MNIRDKKLAIYAGRNNWKALHNLHRKSFGFKVEGPDTYIWDNHNSRATNVIAVKDMVEDKKCFKVAAKSYELFKGSWFVTHPDGTVFFLDCVEYTLGYYNKFNWEAWYREGNNVTYKSPKQGDYKVPHLCFGWSIVGKDHLERLRKEVIEDKKESWFLTDSSIAADELALIEAFIKKESIAI